MVNGEQTSVPAGLNVASLLTELGLADRHVAVEVNRELVPKAAHVEHVIRDGDTIEIVTLVGGG